MKVAVVFDGASSSGGPDSEQGEIIRGVKSALESGNHEAELFPCGGDIAGFLESVKNFSPRRVFNLAESIMGDPSLEYLMPALLRSAGLSYTGSGPEALALAGDKFMSKSVMKSGGVPVPGFRSVTAPGDARSFPPPFILKPAREHGSRGISGDSVFVDGSKDPAPLAETIIEAFGPAIAERFIEGREISVSLLGEFPYEALPPSEILFHGSSRICTYGAKWLPESGEFRDTPPECPAKLDEKLLEKARTAARAAARAHSVSGYARIDMRLAQNGEFFVIDVNPNPDLSRASGLARSALAAGIAYEALIAGILRIY